MKATRIFTVIMVALFTTVAANAQQYRYIGATKCKICHNKVPTGEQYNKWAAGPHAKALKTLSSEKSMTYAKANGIADPTKEAKCLKCHTTFAGIKSGMNMGLKQTEGVSCESCHGPGSAYKALPIMKSREASVAKGLIVPDEATCKKCHNPENPFHKEFDFAAYSAKIDHHNPAAK